MKLKVNIGLLLFMLSMAWGAQCAIAQGNENEEPLRPVASMFSAQYGHATELDTYMSPVKYGGHAVALAYEAQQATGFNPQRWTRQLSIEADYSYTHNPAGNHEAHALMADARWALMHRWMNVLTPNLTLQLGG